MGPEEGAAWADGLVVDSGPGYTPGVCVRCTSVLVRGLPREESPVSTVVDIVFLQWVSTVCGVEVWQYMQGGGGGMQSSVYKIGWGGAP